MRRTRAHLRGKDVGGRICAGSERHREQLVRHLPRLGTPLEALEPRVRLPDLRRRLRTESRAELVDHPESGVVHCLHVILETRRKKISRLQAFLQATLGAPRNSYLYFGYLYCFVLVFVLRAQTSSDH